MSATASMNFIGGGFCDVVLRGSSDDLVKVWHACKVVKPDCVALLTFFSDCAVGCLAQVKSGGGTRPPGNVLRGT